MSQWVNPVDSEWTELLKSPESPAWSTRFNLNWNHLEFTTIDRHQLELSSALDMDMAALCLELEGQPVCRVIASLGTARNSPGSTPGNSSARSADSDISVSDAVRRTCTFVRCSEPLKSPRRCKNLTGILPDETPTVELFIDQLIFNFNVEILCQLLQKLVNSDTPIVSRLKIGPKPTCAFIAVRHDYAEALLRLNRRMLCTEEGVWVAPDHQSEGQTAIDEECQLRVNEKRNGLPNKVVVIERIEDHQHGTLHLLKGKAASRVYHQHQQQLAAAASQMSTTAPTRYQSSQYTEYNYGSQQIGRLH